MIAILSVFRGCLVSAEDVSKEIYKMCFMIAFSLCVSVSLNWIEMKG